MPGGGQRQESLDDDSRFTPEGQYVPPGGSVRVLAALSYIGAMCAPVSVIVPGRQFAFRHSRVALALHVGRFIWVSVILFIWWTTRPANDRTYTFADFMADAALLLVVGVPRVDVFSQDISPWIVTPLVVMWALSLMGFVLALTGRTADLEAFISANWNEMVWTTGWSRARAAEERRRARIARQRQLDRLQRTTLAMGVERERRERRTEVEDAIQRLQAERDHIDHLLSLGEMSRRRYDTLGADIDQEITDLRAELTDITQRTVTTRPSGSTLRAGRLDRAPESEVDTIAIITPSGVPLFTYGNFQLDEALVSGILSAFDSITEEMFGSRVHKTELAEGQVLHFAHGQHVVLLASFIDEPSPRQIEQLRLMLQQFELANAGPLSRKSYDTDFLHEVHIPFRLHQRV
ncbi:MAG TPA: hypothetical protein VMM78_05015 [Thermomicrobiales bacterium]|nr:hypothetical protein [Thermomicrobiales bacterium]